MHTCRACECKQEPADKCRRCGKKLWGPDKPALPPPVVRPTLRQLEKAAIIEAMQYNSAPKAAKLLGISTPAMYAKIKRYGLPGIRKIRPKTPIVKNQEDCCK